MNRKGERLDSEALVISTTAYTESRHDVTFDGTNHLVFWIEQKGRGGRSGVYGARITTEGEILDREFFLVSLGGSSPAVAFGGTSHYVVWADSRNEWEPAWGGPELPCGMLYVEPDIYGALVSASGTVLDSVATVLPTIPNWQQNPAAAYDGTNYMVAWTQWRNDWRDREVCAASVSPYGIVDDPIHLATCGLDWFSLQPQIAFDGKKFMVVWNDSRKIYGVRIAAGGEVLDPDPILVSADWRSHYSPAIASDGRNFMVVWSRADPVDFELTLYDICGARVNPSGMVLDPEGIQISKSDDYRPVYGSGCDFAPAIAYDGMNYLVVWERWRSGGSLGPGMYYCEGPQHIAGALMSRSGEVLDELFISRPEQGDLSPSLTFGGSKYLVTWRSLLTKDGGSVWNVVARRVSPSGAFFQGEPVQVAPSNSDQFDPAVAFDGSDYVIVWRSRTNGTQKSPCHDLHSVRLDPSNSLPDSTAFEISSGDCTHGAPAVAAAGPGQVLFAYPLYGGPSYPESYRIFGKVMTPEKVPVPPQLSLSPTPFRFATQISYFLPASVEVRLTVYDTAGRLVRTLVDGQQGPGWHRELWNGRDSAFEDVPSGVYFIRLESDFGRATAKCIYVQ